MPTKKALKIVQINTVQNGSTGSIMMSLHKQLLQDGYDSYVVWGRGRKAQNKNEFYMGDKLSIYFHFLYSRLTGKTGFASKRITKKLLKKLDLIKPDVIHLHNLHGYYINIELLFNYIKKHNIKTIWTLHDCWAFTGHCCYFDISKCKCWQGHKCIDIKSYPKSSKNASLWCYRKKKQLFTGVKNMMIITPSSWLMGLVKDTFLKHYSCHVINNGIDTDVFKELDSKKLTFRKKYGLEDKIIILGVASPWTERKGLNDFIELSEKIDNKKYQIILVGLLKKQIKHLPRSILGLERTNNVDELVEIYNSANIFINPTREDNYPTSNIEAIACGIPTITYNSGGSGESVISAGGILVRRSEFLKNPNLFLEKALALSVNIYSVSSITDMYQQYKVLYEE